MNIADYNGVWVFAEQREGKLQKVSLELLGEGRRQADKLGVKLTALLLAFIIISPRLMSEFLDGLYIEPFSNFKSYVPDTIRPSVLISIPMFCPPGIKLILLADVNKKANNGRKYIFFIILLSLTLFAFVIYIKC